MKVLTQEEREILLQTSKTIKIKKQFNGYWYKGTVIVGKDEYRGRYNDKEDTRWEIETTLDDDAYNEVFGI